MSKLGLKRYLLVPRDLETISRSIQRKMRGGYRAIPHDYISGDSFKARCELEVNSDNWKNLLVEELGCVQESTRVFVPGMPQSNVLFRAVEFLKENPNLVFPNVSLVLHNGDHWPDFEGVKVLAARFEKIFAVNWLGNIENVIPIPIGLENQGLLVNGVIEDFIKLRARSLEWSTRPIKVLVCFSINTNPIERKKALEIAKRVDGAYVVHRPVTPKVYRELISRAMYTLSPPGNGIDCHRTWEALFLGSVPIVKREFWPFSSCSTGAQVLEDWNEMLEGLDYGQGLNSEITESMLKVDRWLQN